jgi:hypothetical protein
MTDLPHRLRELATWAEVHGAPRELLDAVLPPLLELLLDATANRRLKALEAAARTRALAERLEAGGYQGGDLRLAVRARLGISERTYYRHRASTRGRTYGTS